MQNMSFKTYSLKIYLNETKAIYMEDQIKEHILNRLT